ncbi:hypothetical protein BGX27_007817 [Mortierella sp. AM989]|nr:hypothetical protein BGX27_007817 [Mortierella sp. AM989]
MDNQIDLSTPRHPLDMPEILFLILSFLTQHTLKSSVSLVCSKWCYTARPLIRFRIDWNNKSSDKRIRKISSRFHPRIELHVDSNLKKCLHYSRSEDQWEHLRQLVIDLGAKGQLFIAKLELTNVANFRLTVLPTLQSLTTLEDIHIAGVFDQDVRLDEILGQCPKLLRFHLDNRLEKPTKTNVIVNRTVILVEEGILGAFRSFRITSLTMRSVWVEQESLERIIKKSPRLRALRLEDIRHNNPYHPSLFSTVANSCPRLNMLHFSAAPKIGSAEESAQEKISRDNAMSLVETFFPTCTPGSTNLPGKSSQHRVQHPHRVLLDTISFQDIDICKDTSPILFAPLLDKSLNLTTLEITTSPSGKRNDCVTHALHNVLCSATNLQHLLAPTVQYFAEYVDFSAPIPTKRTYPIWNCYPRCPASKSGFVKKRIWSCRGLKTLQLRFISRLQSDPANFYKAAAVSRVIFGYVSTVCPNLTELAICGDILHLGLAGGLCFLSRLRKLEILKARTWRTECLDIGDLRWMARRSSNNGAHLAERRINAPQAQVASLTVESLREVGSEANVGVYLELLKHGTNGEDCWPLLEYLGLQVSDTHTRNKGASPETIVAMVRPDVKFSSKLGM